MNESEEQLQIEGTQHARGHYLRSVLPPPNPAPPEPMKKQITTLVLSLVLATCSTMTPDQAQQYANVAHSVVHGGISDYKQVAPLIKK